jgi:Flp pilus assembly secretin CpaC
MQPSALTPPRRSSPYRKIANAVTSLLMAALFVALFAGLSNASDRNSLNVSVDQATLIRLDRHGAEVIIGNPSIADVSVQSSKLLVLTGKSAGLTNLIVLDGSGKEVLNEKIIVSADNNQLITVSRGASRETYTCSPNCIPALTSGDNEQFFESLSKEIRNKLSLAQSSAEGTPTTQQ